MYYSVSSLFKAVTIYGIPRMGRNFDDYPDFQQKARGIYIRTVSSVVRLFPPWLVWGRNQVYCAFCSVQTAHKIVQTG